ncbi:group I intron-associated PD-(D/E)XK endonuclease [Evansella sp. LMS18]|uniref:group I intron-associated PD-(D/E)XK endonuclease n=1 Tax=Evansella sp. LMS18 TaxID=2924033 RepID=UPI0020D0E02D|nr:group I intron-associated PD-(D/E)XK endonuclease [Evansella sp. LMS18]UTR11293.1 group I intron-associated PD-(D/E)XK endonuclease [Evansella sp. LMS18]
MYHQTKNKGDLGVLKAQVDLYQKGYMILTPQTEHAPFDIVTYKDFSFKRVQVKYREVNARGNIEIRFRSSYINSSGNINKPVNKDHVDVYCVYCPQTDECYYFNPKKYNNSLTLRINLPKNSQKENIHMASDYRNLP